MRFTTIAPLALLCACAGSAQAATRTWQIGDVTRIRAQGPFDVRVRTGVPAGVRATGPQEAIDRVIVDQRGDLLVLRAQPGRWGGWLNRDKTPLVVEVGTRSLVAASADGSGDVSIDRVRGDALDLAVAGSGGLTVGAVEVDRLKLAANGSGDLTAAGRARTAAVSIGGSGGIDAAKLVAGEASVTSAGSGDVDVAAQRRATISTGGSGDVTISGPAACTIARRGSGDVTCNGRTTDD